MFCSACGAAIDATDKHSPRRCAHCGVPFAEEPDDGITVVGAHVELSCPLCRVPLVSAVIEEENVSYCGTCHGFLADTDTFSAIVAKRSNPPPKGVMPAPSAVMAGSARFHEYALAAWILTSHSWQISRVFSGV